MKLNKEEQEIEALLAPAKIAFAEPDKRLLRKLRYDWSLRYRYFTKSWGTPLSSNPQS